MKIISISGKKGSGKNYIANKLAEKINEVLPNVKINFLAFGDPLKQCISAITGIPELILNDADFKKHAVINLKSFELTNLETNPEIIVHELTEMNPKSINESDEYWVSIRSLYQYFGTELIRNQLSSDLWVTSLLTKLREHQINIVTDTRLQNEFNTLKILGGITINVIGDSSNADGDKHISENDLNDEDFDFTIYNIRAFGDNSLELDNALTRLVNYIVKFELKNE